MVLFWAIAAALMVAALLFLLPPLMRSRTAAPDAQLAANAAIYHEQLEDLAAELQRGALSQQEFERAGREIERRVVAEHAAAGPAPATQRSPVAAALALGLLLPLAVVMGYLQLGNPGALSAAAASDHQVEGDQIAALVQRLEARLQQTPEDVEGWILLGRSFSALEQYERAAKAYAQGCASDNHDCIIGKTFSK